MRRLKAIFSECSPALLGLPDTLHHLFFFLFYSWIIPGLLSSTLHPSLVQLTLLEGGVIVFGNPSRLCREAKEQTLQALVARHPEVVRALMSHYVCCYVCCCQVLKPCLLHRMPPACAISGTSDQCTLPARLVLHSLFDD